MPKPFIVLPSEGDCKSKALYEQLSALDIPEISSRNFLTRQVNDRVHFSTSLVELLQTGQAAVYDVGAREVNG